MAKYVVVADAAVITVGKKANGKPATARVLRGETLTVADESNDTLQALLGAGAVVKAESAEHAASLKSLEHRLTAKKAAEAVGAYDEVQPEALPLDAPLPDADATPERRRKTKAPVEA